MSDEQIDPLTGLPLEDSGLAALSELAKRQLALENKIKEREAELSMLKSQRDKISMEVIPQKLEELGLSEIKTDDGHRVTIKPFYSTKIIDEHAFNWLDENGHGGVIKTTVAKNFTRDEREEALEFAEAHADEGFEYNESVHFMTLMALTKELDQQGIDLPEDYFKVFKGKKTVIK